MAWFGGCASNKAADGKGASAKRITGITTEVSADSVIVTIHGNQTLTYTAIKQVFPMGVLFHFPETSLATDETVTTPPQNEIIGSVKATELVEEKSTTSRIFIALKTDAPYDLNPQDSGLQVSFPKVAAGAAAPPAPVAKKPSAPQPAPQPSVEDLPAASQLKTVTANSPASSLTCSSLKALLKRSSVWRLNPLGSTRFAILVIRKKFGWCSILPKRLWQNIRLHPQPAG